MKSISQINSKMNGASKAVRAVTTLLPLPLHHYLLPYMGANQQGMCSYFEKEVV